MMMRGVLAAAGAMVLSMLMVVPASADIRGQRCSAHTYFDICASVQDTGPGTMAYQGNFTTLGGKGVEGRTRRVSLQRKTPSGAVRVHTYAFNSGWQPSYGIGSSMSCSGLKRGYYRAVFVAERRGNAGGITVKSQYSAWIARSALC